MASLPAPDKSYDELLIEGVAQFLAAADVASWDGGPAGDSADAYVAGVEWPIFPGPDFPAGNDKLATLIMITSTGRTQQMANRETVLQFWLRGPAVSATVTEHDAKTAVTRKAQQIADLFYPHGRPLVHTRFGFIRIGAVLPVNGSLLPRESDRRYSHVANYRFRGRRV